MNKTTRSYDSSNRKLQAQKNRESVLRVSRDLFQKQGFKKTSIEQIAKESGLAKPTVYALFKSKEGILLAIIDSSISKESFEDLVRQACRGETAKERFDITAKMCREIYEAESTNLASLKNFAGISPEVKNLENQMEERRYLRQEKSVKQMKNMGLIKSNISVQKARDVIWALTGRDFYRMLVTDRGWSPSEYETWVSKTLLTTLGNEENHEGEPL